MPFQKIEAEKLSQSVVQQIELLILRGILQPGERLPSERELSDRLGVSRPSLREAVAGWNVLLDTTLQSGRPKSESRLSDSLDLPAFSTLLLQAAR